MSESALSPEPEMFCCRINSPSCAANSANPALGVVLYESIRVPISVWRIVATLTAFDDWASTKAAAACAVPPAPEKNRWPEESLAE
jgi:hypothetical protein